MGELLLKWMTSTEGQKGKGGRKAGSPLTPTYVLPLYTVESPFRVVKPGPSLHLFCGRVLDERVWNFCRRCELS